MTAPDPRVGEIEARLAATESKTVYDAVFGDILRTGWCTYYFGADNRWHNARTGEVIEDLDGLEDERLAEDEASEWLTPHAPADVSYLLAELRKAHEALARVEDLADAFVKRGEHLIEFAKTAPEDVAESLTESGGDFLHKGRLIRAAVAAATGGGR